MAQESERNSKTISELRAGRARLAKEREDMMKKLEKIQSKVKDEGSPQQFQDMLLETGGQSPGIGSPYMQTGFGGASPSSGVASPGSRQGASPVSPDFPSRRSRFDLTDDAGGWAASPIISRAASPIVSRFRDDENHTTPRMAPAFNQEEVQRRLEELGQGRMGSALMGSQQFLCFC